MQLHLDSSGDGRRVASLYGRGLDAVPEWVFEEHRLESLNLSQNRLADLPAAIGRLTGLRMLDLGHNRLHRLPAALGGLARLGYLYVGGTPLRGMPGDVLAGRTGLRHLSAAGAEIEALPDALACVPDPFAASPDCAGSTCGETRSRRCRTGSVSSRSSSGSTCAGTGSAGTRRARPRSRRGGAVSCSS